MAERSQVVVVGAGPYGLSIAAHLQAAGVRFRIFGAPMSTWREQMPAGMYLKSDGFASNLSEPSGALTLQQFCAERGIEYDHTRVPVRLDTFVDYGMEFQRRFVPNLEHDRVDTIERSGKSFSVRLSNGETIQTDRVVMAVGITHFHHMPEIFKGLPSNLITHSSAQSDPAAFRGRKVTVVGGGASAIDLSALLHEAGAEVTLVARQPQLYFHDAPGNSPRSLLSSLRHPQSGIGPGLRSRFYTDAPLLFRYLPKETRVKIIRTHLRPAAGWPMKERTLGKFPQILGHSIAGAAQSNGGVQLVLRSPKGEEVRHNTGHVIAATGYRADIERLGFLDPGLRKQIKTVGKTPLLSTNFESSVPGMYFVGLCAAHTFGPMLRFAYGADFTARHLNRHLSRVVK